MMSVHDGSQRPLRLVLLILSLLAGVVTALTLMPKMFRVIPTDISRIGVLLEAMRDPGERPKIVVFGNSVVMSGIDAAQLTAELPRHPLAWNLASTGQTLVESSLLTQEIPASTRVVVYTTPLRPRSPEVALHSQKNNAFWMYGFRANAETRATLSQIYGTPVENLLNRSRFSQIFQARWALRQLLDTQLRILLRRDLTLANAETDLFHPQRYAVPISQDLLERFLEKKLTALAGSPAGVPEEDRELVRTLAQLGAREGRHTVLLIPPVHPALLAEHADSFARGADAFERAVADSPGTVVVDASRILGASDFIDTHHPTNEGAVLLTRRLSRHIAEAL